MANAGKCNALKSREALSETLRYLVDGNHPNHRHYLKPKPLKCVGLTNIGEFVPFCEKQLRRRKSLQKIHTAKPTTVLALWWMPRFANGVTLTPKEERRVGEGLFAALPPGVVIASTWHLPDPQGKARRKGPDFNFVFSNATRGPLPLLARDSTTSLWGTLTQTMDRIVEELNMDRKKTGHMPIPTMAWTKRVLAARRARRRPTGRLCDQLATIPGAGDNLDSLTAALHQLGYELATTPTPNTFSILRRHHPPLKLRLKQNRHRFKGRGYRLNLNRLLADTRKAEQALAQSAPKAKVTLQKKKTAGRNTPPAPGSSSRPGVARATDTRPSTNQPQTIAAADAKTVSPTQQVQVRAPAPVPKVHSKQSASHGTIKTPTAEHRDAASQPVKPSPPAAEAKDVVPIPAPASPSRALPTPPQKSPTTAAKTAVQSRPAVPPAVRKQMTRSTPVPAPKPPAAPDKTSPAPKPTPSPKPRTAPPSAPPTKPKPVSPPKFVESATPTSKKITPPPPVHPEPPSVSDEAADPAESEAATESTEDLVSQLVEQILEAVTSNDPIPTTFEDCFPILRRSGVAFVPPEDDAGEATLGHGEATCRGRCLMPPSSDQPDRYPRPHAPAETPQA